MGMIRWLKKTARRSSVVVSGGHERGELASDLRVERLRRAVRDFPGRQDADLARIIYGRDEADLVAADGRALEAAGLIQRDPESGGLYTAR
jgi:hypothetical protein